MTRLHEIILLAALTERLFWANVDSKGVDRSVRPYSLTRAFAVRVQKYKLCRKWFHFCSHFINVQMPENYSQIE